MKKEIVEHLSPEEILKSIENTEYYGWTGEIVPKLKAALNKAKKEGKVQLAEQAQFEFDAFSIEVKNPFLNSGFKTRFVKWFAEPNGDVPYTVDFSNEQLAYYEKRLEESVNPFLKTRYADILFDRYTNQRNLNKFDLGKKLCDLLLEAGGAHLRQTDPKLEEFIKNIARTIDVALTLNNKQLITNAVEILIPVLNGLSESDLRHIILISWIMKAVAGHHLSSSVTTDVYETVADKVEKARWFSWQNKDLLNWYRDFCDELIYWSDFLRWGDDRTESLRDEIGRSYEEEAAYARDHIGSHMLEARVLEEALDYNVNRGNSSKVRELKKKIQSAHAASRNEYQEIQSTFKISMEVEREFLKSYEDLELDECLDKIGSDPRMIVDLETVERQVKEAIEASPLFSRMSSFVVDKDRKVFEANSEEGLNKLWSAQNYKARVLINTNLYLSKLFSFLTENKNLTVQNLISYLRNRSSLDDDNAHIIEAGLNRIFCEDYVSALHVIVPQIEALVRTVFANTDVPTTVRKPRAVQHVQTLTEFLEQPEVKKVFGKNIHKYLQFVLVDPLGFNLRNDIAHGLIEYSECNENNSLVILHLLIILSRYRIQQLK